MRALLLFVFVVSAPLLWAQNTLIHAGKLFDPVSGRYAEKVSLVVEGETIVELRDGFTKPNGKDAFIDLSNYSVFPGFIDLHVHLENETSPTNYLDRFTQNPEDIAFESTVYARRTLEAGFTTVRDLGGTGVNTALRNAINKGWVIGPRVYSAGKSIATTGGHADPSNGMRRDITGDPGAKQGVVNGVEDARKAVRQRYKNGADVIKITATGGVLSVAKSGQAPQFVDEELRAIIATAEDYGMHVAAHAHGEEGMYRAVAAGVKTVEHGTFMSERVMALMMEKQAYLIPTITAGKWVAEKAKVKGYYPPLVVPKALEIGPKIQATFAKAYKRGVRIGFGTDAGVFPHGQNAKEFGYMVEAGMPEVEAIRSATLTAAQILGEVDRLGQLKKGFWADMVAFEGDPLKDISLLERPAVVIKGGRKVE